MAVLFIIFDNTAIFTFFMKILFKRTLALLLFVTSVVLFHTLFALLVSSKADDYTFFNLAFGFLSVVLTGKWFLKYNSKWFYVFSVSVFFIIVGVLVKDLSRVGILILLLPITTYLAFKALEKKKFIKNGIIVVLISFFGSYYVFPNYFQFYQAYIKKEVKINQPFPNIGLTNKNKEQVMFDKDKIIVLDFWTTSCGVCFREFPLFNDLTLKYKDNSQIEFYSVNVPLKRDAFEKNVEIIEEYKYSFKNIYAISDDEISEKLNIYAFPTIVIIKDNMIVYQGHPSYDKKVLVDNFEKIITELMF